ncbi:MAG: DUF697 domain-containing protein [Magnetococcales bacterium]|nr:DUF697 domain-containing protein [Magnetococcales bacterium]NGZ05843.1 DUF697 domain-containing protein [Magnetococcales bacterium]
MIARPKWIPPVEISLDPPEEPTAPPTGPVCLPLSGMPKQPPEPEIAPPEEELDGLRDPVFIRAGVRWRWFFWGVALLVGGLMLEQSILFLVEQFRLHPVAGLFFGGVVGLLLMLLATAIFQELTGLRALRAQEAVRHTAAQLMSGGSFGSAQPMIQRWLDQYGQRPELREAFDDFRALNQSHLGDQEMLELFSARAMRPLDETALRIIGRHAASAAMLSVVSPLALLDAMIFMWRNVRMMREIATVYGLRPGPMATIVLMRNLAEGMLAAGASELVARGAVEALGETLTSVAMAGAGQAATSALFTARIGLKCLHMCRPLPFPKADEPGLRHIRRELRAALAAPKA